MLFFVLLNTVKGQPNVSLLGRCKSITPLKILGVALLCRFKGIAIRRAYPFSCRIEGKPDAGGGV